MRHKNAIQISDDEKTRAQTGKKRESFVTVTDFSPQSRNKKN